MRIFYTSDFDPAGRSMPVAVARRVEFWLHKNNVDIDLKLIPLVLSEKQCGDYRLPRIPIKETEKRAAKFEARFGSGATELDALEALRPGELKTIVSRAFDRYIDQNYQRDLHVAASEYRADLDDLNEMAHEGFDIENNLRADHEKLMTDWQKFRAQLEVKFESIRGWLEEHQPDDFEPPEYPEADDPDDEDVLLDTSRDYFTQCDAYQVFKHGDEE